MGGHGQRGRHRHGQEHRVRTEISMGMGTSSFMLGGYGRALLYSRRVWYCIILSQEGTGLLLFYFRRVWVCIVLVHEK